MTEKEFTGIVHWLYLNDNKYQSVHEWREAFLKMLLEKVDK